MGQLDPDGSTPSSPSTRRTSAIVPLPGLLWTITGAPVSPWARATARMTRSTPGVRPWWSMAHLKNAALMSVPWMPSRMSRTNRSTIGSGRPGMMPGPRMANQVGTSEYV